MSRLFFSIPARIDLIHIEAYIAQSSEMAAVNLVDRIEAGCRFLAAAPRAGRARPDLRRGVRAWALGSYLVIYRIVAAGVEIMRVIDGRRDVRAVIRRRSKSGGMTAVLRAVGREPSAVVSDRAGRGESWNRRPL